MHGKPEQNSDGDQEDWKEEGDDSGHGGTKIVKSWSSVEVSLQPEKVMGSGRWLENEDNFITSASKQMFGVTVPQHTKSGSPIFPSFREDNHNKRIGMDWVGPPTEDGSMRDPFVEGSAAPPVGRPSCSFVSVSASFSSPSTSSSCPPHLIASSSPATTLTSFPNSDDPKYTNPHNNQIYQFLRFLRSDIAVKAVFEVAGGTEPDLPLSFFILCHSFGAIPTALLALLPPNPPLLQENDGGRPLLSFFSCLLHSIGHSYLHSVVGTFTRLCQKSFFPKDLAGSIKRKRDLLASPQTRQSVEQGFEYLIKMIAVSIPEIPKEIKDAYAYLFNISKDNYKQRRNFVLHSFLSNFVSSALASPEVTLNLKLSPGMKVFCSLLALLLKLTTIAPTTTNKTTHQFLNSLAKSTYVQRKIDFICSHLILDKGEEDLTDCYIDFLKIWEVYHHPCERSGKKLTCLTGEPTQEEALEELGKMISRYQALISQLIVQQTKMGVHSLDLEAFLKVLEAFQGEGSGATRQGEIYF